MSAPAIIWLALQGIILLFGAHMHGKPRPNYDFWAIGLAFLLEGALLWWGGFFA